MAVQVESSFWEGQKKIIFVTLSHTAILLTKATHAFRPRLDTKQQRLRALQPGTEQHSSVLTAISKDRAQTQRGHAAG